MNGGERFGVEFVVLGFPVPMRFDDTALPENPQVA